MPIRHAVRAALLVSAALTLTACGPDDGGTAAPAASDSSAAAVGKPAAGASSAPTGGGAKSGSKGDGCPALAPGHRFIHVDHVEGAMNNIVASEARQSCSSMGEGAFYHPVGALKTFAFSVDSKVTVIGKDGPKVTHSGSGGADGGIAHVKSCADPKGKQYMAAPLPKGYFCYGQNNYDVAVDSHNAITEMTELYGS